MLFSSCCKKGCGFKRQPGPIPQVSTIYNHDIYSYIIDATGAVIALNIRHHIDSQLCLVQLHDHLLC